MLRYNYFKVGDGEKGGRESGEQASMKSGTCRISKGLYGEESQQMCNCVRCDHMVNGEGDQLEDQDRNEAQVLVRVYSGGEPSEEVIRCH